MHAVRPIVVQPPASIRALRLSIARRARAHAGAMRRDQRRFGHAQPRYDALPEDKPAPSLRFADFKLFAHTFAAGFLFVSVFIA